MARCLKKIRQLIRLIVSMLTLQRFSPHFVSRIPLCPTKEFRYDIDFQWLVSVPLCMLVMERPRCDEWGEMTWWHGDTPINIQIQDAQIISKNVQIGWETDTGHQNSASILHNLGVIKFLRFYKPEQLHQWRWVGRSAGAISAVANTEVTTYFRWQTSFSLNR